MITRRLWLSAAAASVATLIPGPAIAAEPLEVAASSHALGAVVRAEGGAAVTVRIDRALNPGELRLAGAVRRVAPAQRDHLDDPRNAPRVGAAVRNILAAARPELAPEFERNHKTWTHAFVRKVMGWNARVAASPVRGKRIINTFDRATLLAWAGAVVDPAGQPSPPALARAPRDATAATLASYVEYIEALVRSLG